MTEWQHYPRAPLSLPADGKVTGHAEVTFYGDGRVGVLTPSGDASISYHGEDWHVNTRWHRNRDGSWTEESDNWGHVAGHERFMSDSTPPTYRARIIAAIATELPKVWTAALNSKGLWADVAQHLNHLEQLETEARQKLAKIRAEIRTERKRLS